MARGVRAEMLPKRSHGHLSDVARGVTAWWPRRPWREPVEPFGRCVAGGPLLRICWDRLGLRLGAASAVVGLSWRVRGPLRAREACRLDPLRTIFGASWGPLWGLWGPSWAVSGLSWAVLGASWAVLGRCWGSWAVLEPALGSLGQLLGSSSGCLGGHLGLYGAILGLSWAVLGPSWAVL